MRNNDSFEEFPFGEEPPKLRTHGAYGKEFTPELWANLNPIERVWGIKQQVKKEEPPTEAICLFIDGPYAGKQALQLYNLIKNNPYMYFYGTEPVEFQYKPEFYLPHSTCNVYSWTEVQNESLDPLFKGKPLFLLFYNK